MVSPFNSYSKGGERQWRSASKGPIFLTTFEFITVAQFIAIAQFISICRWLKLIDEERLAPLENAPFSTQRASKTMQRSPVFPPVLTRYKLL
jgi:hypothetical protein